MIEHKERGFSLLELLIAMLLTVGLMGAVMSLTSHNQQVFVTEIATMDMNQNLRTAMDMLTRDIQSAGMGLPRDNGSFSAVFYTNGASGAPDTLMMVNGDPFAPWADVRETGANEFFCDVPPDLEGAGTNLTYKNEQEAVTPIFKQYATRNELFLCYDNTNARVMRLSHDGEITGVGENARLRLRYQPANYGSPAGTFGSLIDTGEPDYENARIAKLSNLVAYRLNQATRELERTEDLINWQTVARGALNLQLQFRIMTIGAGGPVESVVDAPADRRTIRAVYVHLVAETPDIPQGDKKYRRIEQSFECAPRNFNLANNNNLSQHGADEWIFE